MDKISEFADTVVSEIQALIAKQLDTKTNALLTLDNSRSAAEDYIEIVHTATDKLEAYNEVIGIIQKELEEDYADN